MPTPLLTLGSFAFEGLESPERILLKSKQRLVIHHLGSGLTTIDSLGEDYEIVSFRGIFSGKNAASRIRAIEHLKTQGDPLPLVWSSRLLSVLIHGFELNYTSGRWIPYRLTCHVVHPSDPRLALASNIMSGSPAVLVNDIVTLLQYTDINPEPPHITGLLELAEMDYDMASSEALNQGRDLVQQVETRVAVLEREGQEYRSDASQPYEAEVSDMAALSVGVGEQANLILALGRLMEITVRAERVSQL
jgi:hypothetical protein